MAERQRSIPEASKRLTLYFGLLGVLFFWLAPIAFSPLSADTRLTPNSKEERKLCTCGCDHHIGSAMCTAMCHAAGIHNRLPAKSCQTQSLTPHSQSRPKPSDHSRKRNSVQYARR